MLVPSSIDGSSLGELCPSPIKSTDESIQTITQQIGSSSLLMHSSFGVHRHHSDDLASQSFTATTSRPRRSISSSSGQTQTRHIICPLKNSPQSEHEDFDDDDDDDELNLAVVIGNEDGQSLRGYPTDGVNQENGSLDVAFIDEADFERLVHQQTTNEIERDLNQSSSSMNIEINDQHQTSAMMVSILMEKSMNKEEDLDEILRRNANRAIRLTDSDVRHFI